LFGDADIASNADACAASTIAPFIGSEP